MKLDEEETRALIEHYARQISYQCSQYGYPERNQTILAIAGRLFELARSLPKAQAQ